MKEWIASLKEINEARLNHDIINVGTTQLTGGEARRIYEYGYYVVNGRGVWQIDYSNAQQTFIARLILKYKGLTRRGRYYVMDAALLKAFLLHYLKTINKKEI